MERAENTIRTMRLADGTPINIEGEPYDTCSTCVVQDWCRRRSGQYPLPEDYIYNTECNGFVLLERALRLSNIPLEYRYANKYNYIFDKDNIEYKDVLEDTFARADDFVNKGANILFVHPQKGTGKTRAACTIGNEYIYKTCMKPGLFDFENPLVLYVKYGAWANEIRHMYKINDEDYNLHTLHFLQKMKDVPLLILDDIGSGRLTPIILDLTYDIIDYRKENKKSTIYTTNIPVSQLKTDNFLGDIIVSRMLFRTTVFQLGGRDRREEEVYVM